jgi:hypothetical protein
VGSNNPAATAPGTPTRPRPPRQLRLSPVQRLGRSSQNASSRYVVTGSTSSGRTNCFLVHRFWRIPGDPSTVAAGWGRQRSVGRLDGCAFPADVVAAPATDQGGITGIRHPCRVNAKARASCQNAADTTHPPNLRPHEGRSDAIRQQSMSPQPGDP